MKNKVPFIRLLVFFILLLFSSELMAQNYVDLLKVEYSLSSGNEFENEAGDSDVKEFVVDLTLPIVLSEKSTLLTGFLYESVKMRPYAGMDELSIYTLNMKLGMNWTYSQKWSATYLLLPKFSSDLQNFKGQDFQFGVVSIFKFIKNENVSYKFGAYYNSELFGPFLVPMVGLYYQKNKVEVNLMLPLSADLNYSLAKPLRVGVKFSGFIKSFNLNDTYNGMDQYISKANNEVGAYLGYTKGSILITGMVGTSIGRSYRTYEQDDQLGFALSAVKFGDERSQLNTDFSDGLIIKTSLIYRFMIKKEDK